MKKSLGIFLVVVIGGMIGLLVMTDFAIADVPSLMHYQGKLTDVNGDPVPDDDYDFRFRIYTDSVGGEVLWEEFQSNTPVASGLFNVVLGDSTPIPDTVFTGPKRWLGILVQPNPELTPRNPIVSVGYAFRSAYAQDADRLDSLDSQQFLRSDQSDTLHGNLYVTEDLGVGDDLTVGDDATVEDYLRVKGEVYIYENGMVPPGGYQLYVDGKTWIKGTLKLKFDFDTTFAISEGQMKTINHNIGGDEKKYIVYVDGSTNSSFTPIHQANYGTAPFKYIGVWYQVGCEWYDLTSSHIIVSRADDDNALFMPEEKQWDYARVRILKNQ